MPITIKDQEVNFTPTDVPIGLSTRLSVTARPTSVPFWVLVSGTFVQDQARLRTASYDSNGNWYMTLPWPSESQPSSVQWTIVRSDGTALSGTVPEGVAGPVTVAQLLSTYGWSYTTLPASGNVNALSLTLTAPQEFTVTGSPSGGNGTIGLSWANEAGNTVFAAPVGTTGIPGFRLLDPTDIPNLDSGKITSGTLSLARLAGITTTQLSGSAGITSGQIASLDAGKLTGTVPLGTLSGITTTQLSATAGILAGQIVSVNPSALTGSGTVPLLALTGITTTQLSGSAGIVAGQITSVNPSALTGSGTVPLGALSGITTTQLSATAGILAGQLAVSNPTSGQIGGLTTSNLSATAGITSGQIASLPTHAVNHEAGGSDDFYVNGGHELSTRLEIMSRLFGQGTNGMVSGQLLLSFFTANRNFTVNNISIQTGGTTTAAGCTLCRFGIYTANASDATTLVAATASDTTLLAAQNTLYTKALSLAGDLSTAQTTYSLTRGSRYAIGVIWVGTTAPTLIVSFMKSTMCALSPMINGARGSQTDLTLSNTAATAPAASAAFYAHMT